MSFSTASFDGPLKTETGAFGSGFVFVSFSVFFLSRERKDINVFVHMSWTSRKRFAVIITLNEINEYGYARNFLS